MLEKGEGGREARARYVVISRLSSFLSFQRLKMSSSSSSQVPPKTQTLLAVAAAAASQAGAAQEGKARGANRSTKVAGKLKVLPDQPEIGPSLPPSGAAAAAGSSSAAGAGAGAVVRQDGTKVKEVVLPDKIPEVDEMEAGADADADGEGEGSGTLEDSEDEDEELADDVEVSGVFFQSL